MIHLAFLTGSKKNECQENKCQAHYKSNAAMTAAKPKIKKVRDVVSYIADEMKQTDEYTACITITGCLSIQPVHLLDVSQILKYLSKFDTNIIHIKMPCCLI